MLYWIIIKVGIKALWANKLRSFLAILGIVIGVAAVTSMLALGAGAKQKIMEDVSGLGDKVIVVRPGQAGTRGVFTGIAQTLTEDDAKSIAEKIEGIEWVTPVVNASLQIKYLAKNNRVIVYGVAPNYLEVRSFKVEKGRNFTDAEAKANAKVAILGKTTVKDLFGNEDPIGKSIKIKGISFKVIGVLKEKGDQGWYDPDDQAIIPYTTAMKQILGVDKLREIDVLVNKNIENYKVVQEIEKLLRKKHKIPLGTPNDFSVKDLAEIIEMVDDIADVFTLLIGGIAAISLLVGGIGIMNIMLVTVAERTKEIGLRKAIGAKEKDILRQFLTEAMLVSMTGGVLGIIGGLIMSYIISEASIMLGTNFKTIFEWESAAIVMAVAAIIGIFFGYYPAKRAAKLDPVDALRYE